MRTVTTTYTQVRRTAVKSGFCLVCGGAVTRQRTFGNTVNPFNRNELGAVRTYGEVMDSVNQLCADWIPDFTHKVCKG